MPNYEDKITDKLKLQTDVDYIGQRSDNTSDVVERNLLSATLYTCTPIPMLLPIGGDSKLLSCKPLARVL